MALWNGRRTARSLAAEVGQRLVPAANGIVPGAEPISLDADNGRGVLLLHGFGDTPQTLHYVAEALHAHGYTVRAPLLPGHGRSLAEFGATRAKQWIAAARTAYEDLTAHHGPSPVVGLSMGGALAIILAAETPTMPALALIAPYVSMPRRARFVARFHPIWGVITPYFRSGGERSIHDESERARNRGYGVLTPGLLFELSRVVRRVQTSLPRIKSPTLVIHGLNDERIPPDAAEREYARLGAPEKRLVWLDQGGHVLTVDHGRDRVIGLVVDWLARHRAAGPPETPTPRQRAGA
ncbi:MAG: alpha/beta fold hydrolase [Gemmatimonadaceae bacterium]|nr:alpha/beta fold hydrolase [Gemmatimonadaceae bacterium]